jgi:hypothetical protein
MLKTNPRLSYKAIANVLSERGMGGATAIARRLPGLLPPRRR